MQICLCDCLVEQCQETTSERLVVGLWTHVTLNDWKKPPQLFQRGIQSARLLRSLVWSGPPCLIICCENTRVSKENRLSFQAVWNVQWWKDCRYAQIGDFLWPSDLRILCKGYLDRRGLWVKQFRNNLPGAEWARSFLIRHKDRLAERLSQNIKLSRTSVSPVTVKELHWTDTNMLHLWYSATYSQGKYKILITNR